jgi:hypothetical protein
MQLSSGAINATILRAPVVVRQSGVWNSRAPFNNYFQINRSINRIKSISSLAIYDAMNRNPVDLETAKTVKQVFNRVRKDGIQQVSIHVRSYRRSYQGQDGDTLSRPNIQDMHSDCAEALQFIQESSIVKIASAFESYVQCWGLNMILSFLECPSKTSKLSEKENNLLLRMLPFSGRPLPSTIDIIIAIDPALTKLSSLPTVTKKGKEYDVLVETDPNLNVFNAIKFWREYRNLCVHNGGLVTTRFFNRNAKFFEQSMGDLDKLKLEVRRPLPFHDVLFQRMASIHYTAALALSQELINVSGERRGHLNAPGKYKEGLWFENPRSPFLLLEGDHPASWNWVNDEAARKRLADQRGWTL